MVARGIHRRRKSRVEDYRVAHGKKGLEQTVIAVIAVTGIAASLFFLSSNITGNVIGNMTQNSSNLVGACLLVMGLVAGYLWIRKR